MVSNVSVPQVVGVVPPEPAKVVALTLLLAPETFPELSLAIT